MNGLADLHEAGLDTCAVCLNQIDEDEAVLDYCYHRFHKDVSSLAHTSMDRNHVVHTGFLFLTCSA